MLNYKEANIHSKGVIRAFE